MGSAAFVVFLSVVVVFEDCFRLDKNTLELASVKSYLNVKLLRTWLVGDVRVVVEVLLFIVEVHSL